MVIFTFENCIHDHNRDSGVLKNANFSSFPTRLHAVFLLKTCVNAQKD